MKERKKTAERGRKCPCEEGLILNHKLMQKKKDALFVTLFVHKAGADESTATVVVMKLKQKPSFLSAV